MKRKERHNIKKDEFSSFMVSFMKAAHPYWKEISITLVIILVVLISGISYKSYVNSKIGRANFILEKLVSSGEEGNLKKFPSPFPKMEIMIKAEKLADSGKIKEAIKLIKHSTHKGILSNYLYFMEGELLYEKGDCKDAIESWKKANRDDENFPYDALLAHMGRCQFELGKERDAISTYNQIIDLFPNSPYVKEAQYKVGSKGAS